MSASRTHLVFVVHDGAAQQFLAEGLSTVGDARHALAFASFVEARRFVRRFACEPRFRIVAEARHEHSVVATVA